MLRCDRAVERANVSDTGALRWHERMLMYMHLMMCHHCRRYLRQLRMLLGGMAETPGQASDEEVEAVMRQLHKD